MGQWRERKGSDGDGGREKGVMEMEGERGE